MESIVGGDLLTLFTWRRFCSLPVGQNIRILEFFGSDLHLDFCTRGCPTPWQPLAEPQASALSLSCRPHCCECNPPVFPVTPIWASPESTLPHCMSVSNVKQRRRRQRASSGSYSSRCMWISMWSTQSGFHRQCPTLAEIQWIGSRPVTSNSLCRFCAVPPVWPICSPGNSLDVPAKAALNPIIRP